MSLLGAHMSIEGGLDQALYRGHEIQCQTIQIFTKSNNQWKSKPLSEEEVAVFKDVQHRLKVRPVVVHDSYLINLGSPDGVIFKKSLEAIVDELVRCERLDIPYLVVHPGAHRGEGEPKAITRIAKAVRMAFSKSLTKRVRILFENTAGQGTQVGYRFEHLAELIQKVNQEKRVGVCFDTQHAFASGYDIRTKESYEAVFREFDRVVGTDQIRAFHVNDSKKELGCRVDRHEHLGKGFIGKEAFGCLVNDARFKETPMILETPKGPDMAEDVVNLNLLRKLKKR